MILLNGQSLTPAGQFEPEAMGLTLEERKSTATMQLGPSAPDIAVGAWLLDNTAPGAGIVWRVKSCDTTYNTKTRNYQLEHVINTLRDRIMFGEIKPEDMGGSGGNCTARQAAQYIINQQSIWALGDFEYNVSNPYQFNGDNLYAALETVTASLEDAVWEYDLTQLPFIIHIRQLSSDVTSEMREGRNIQSLKRTVDRSKMFTRFYPIGENNLHILGNYVSKNESLYGTVCKVETDQSKKTDAELREWANERLSRHCEPAVTVTVQGIDYSQATGEPLDNVQLNKKCRVPLPEYSTSIVETVKKLSWPDKIKEPKRFTVTLANVLEDVASIINRESERSAAGGRGGAAKNEKDHAWFVDTDEHVGMVAEAVAGSIDGHPNWSRVAELMVDGNGIDARVTQAEGEIVTHTSRISMTESAITQEVTDRTNADNTLSGRITVEAGKITQIVTAVGSDGQVTAASIVLAINESTGQSEAKIDSDHVYIGNDKSTTVINGKLNASDVTADYLNAKIATIPTLTGIAGHFSGNVVSESAIIGTGIYIGSTAPYSNVADAITQLQVVETSSGSGVYKIQKKDFGDSGWVDVPGTFSRATTLSGGWGSGTFTVTATPQGNTISTQIVQGAATWSGNTATVPIEAIDSDNPGYQYATGRNISVNATARYNAGWDYGITQRYVSAQSVSGEIPIKTLAYDELWKINFIIPDSSGVDQVSSYTVKAPSSGGGGTVNVVTSGWQDAGMTRPYIVCSPSSGGGTSVSTKLRVRYVNSSGGASCDFIVEADINDDSNFTTLRTLPMNLVADGSWSSNKKKVYLRFGTATTNFAELEVDASSLVTATGLSLDAAHHTVSRVANSSTKEYTVSVSVGGWSGGNATVAAVLGTTQMQTATVSIPAASSWSASYIGIQAGDPKMSVSVSIGGASRTGTVSAAGAYNAGVAAGESEFTAGPKLKYWGNGLLFQNINGTYVPVVNANWYHDLNGTTQYYTKS